MWAALRAAATPMTAEAARKRDGRSVQLSAVGWIGLVVGCILAIAVTAFVDPIAAKVVYAISLLALAAAAAVDVVEQRLPNVLTLGSGGFALVALAAVSIETGTGSPWRAVFAGAIFGAWILLGALAVRGGYGLGDAKLAAACGILAGWLSWQALAIDVLTTQVAITVLLVYAKTRGRRRAALGPAFVVGVLAAIFMS